MIRGRYDYWFSIGALALGFALPFWPLILAGVGGAAASGHPFTSILAAFLFDLLFGEGTGLFTFPFPMTVGTIFIVSLSLAARRYLRA